MDPVEQTVKVYDTIAKKYAELYFAEISDKEETDYFLSLLLKGARILDVGCGPGATVKYFLERGFRVEGVDLSREMLRIAKKLVPKGRFRLMDMRRLEYPENIFKAIYSAYSFIHIPKKDALQTLKEFYRVLKDGGYLYLSLYEGEGEEFLDEPLLKGEKTFTAFYTLEEIKQLLEQAGFEVVKVVEKEEQEEGALGSRRLIVIARRFKKP